MKKSFIFFCLYLTSVNQIAFRFDFIYLDLCWRSFTELIFNMKLWFWGLLHYFCVKTPRHIPGKQITIYSLYNHLYDSYIIAVFIQLSYICISMSPQCKAVSLYKSFRWPLKRPCQLKLKHEPLTSKHHTLAWKVTSSFPFWTSCLF